jgi:hypothetical protein
MFGDLDKLAVAQAAEHGYLLQQVNLLVAFDR